MATQSSNIAHQGTSVPVGKSVTSGATGTQPGQVGMGTNQGTGQLSSQGFPGQSSNMGGAVGTNTNMGGMSGQGHVTEQGTQGQHRGGGSMMDALDDWFRDPFNFGMGGVGSRHRGLGYGNTQAQGGYGGRASEDHLGFMAGPQGNHIGAGLVPFGADIFSEMDRSLMHLGSFTPSMKLDIRENESTFSCSVDMPGVSANDLNVECDERSRTVRINVRKDRKEEREEDINGARVHRIERASGSGYRALRMPPNCDLNNVHANLTNGVLYLTVPKVQGLDSTGRKRITVGSGGMSMGNTNTSMMGTGMNTGMGTGTTGGTAAAGTTSMGAGRTGVPGSSM